MQPIVPILYKILCKVYMRDQKHNLETTQFPLQFLFVNSNHEHELC